MKADGAKQPTGATGSQKAAKVGRILTRAAGGNTCLFTPDSRMASTAGMKWMKCLSHRQGEGRVGAQSIITEPQDQAGLHHSETT